MIGAVLALGAPGGLLVTRSAIAGAFPSPAWVFAELSRDVPGYLYLLVSTTVVFAVLGRILGRAEDRLAARATTDVLTQLSNRRHYESRLAEEVARASRYGTPLSLLLLDVDGLKKINDQGGHVAGDTALRAVGEGLRKTCRRSDTPARTGGDEFAVIAPMTRASEALELANRIRAGLARIPGAPTVSIGVADTETAGPAGMQAAADRALYAAKSSGRDRAVLA
jgi:diguanylate cyclase (GGDEF)-like protein